MHAPAASESRTIRIGLIQGVGAYASWGLLPLYFALVRRVGPLEVVAHRILWSLLLLAALLTVARRWGRVAEAVGNRRAMAMLAASAALISGNWLIYIWAVQQHHVLEGSLGYFLNPLLNVALGVALLRERLSRVQAAAVALAALGVLVLAVGALGGLWISLSLALTFALYGLVRKLAPVEALEGLSIETALLAPFAIGYLAFAGPGLAFGSTAGISTLLALSGIVTAIPLLLFAAAARRLRYSTLGLLQYLAPTLQFLCAVVVLGEHLTTAHMACFALIWSGLALYVGEGLVKGRRRAA